MHFINQELESTSRVKTSASAEKIVTDFISFHKKYDAKFVIFSDIWHLYVRRNLMTPENTEQRTRSDTVCALYGRRSAPGTAAWSQCASVC